MLQDFIEYVRLLLGIVLAVAIVGATNSFLEADVFSAKEQTAAVMAALKKSCDDSVLSKKEDRIRAMLRTDLAESRGVDSIVLSSGAAIATAYSQDSPDSQRPPDSTPLSTRNALVGILHELWRVRLLLAAFLWLFLAVQGWQIWHYTNELGNVAYSLGQRIYLGVTLTVANLSLAAFDKDLILHDSILCPMFLFLFCWLLHDVGRLTSGGHRPWWSLVLWVILDLWGLFFAGYGIVSYGMNLSLGGGRFGADVASLVALRTWEVATIIVLLIANVIGAVLERLGS